MSSTRIILGAMCSEVIVQTLIGFGVGVTAGVAVDQYTKKYFLSEQDAKGTYDNCIYQKPISQCLTEHLNLGVAQGITYAVDKSKYMLPIAGAAAGCVTGIITGFFKGYRILRNPENMEVILNVDQENLLQQHPGQ